MGYWQFFDKDSYTSIHTGGYPRGVDNEVARLYADATKHGLQLYRGLKLNGTHTATIHPISFDGVTPPTAPGNYGNTLDCTWLAINGGGSFGFKLMFSNPAHDSSVLYGGGIRCRTYYAGAKAVGFNVSGSAAVANSGQVMGGEFYLQNSGSYTIVGGGGYPSTALHVKSWLAAACSPAASALWIDDQSTVKATKQRMLDITMNGDIQLDEVFHLYGGTPGAAALFDFETCDQGGGFLTATASGGATRSHKLKCTVDGTTVGYISLTTD